MEQSYGEIVMMDQSQHAAIGGCFMLAMIFISLLINILYVIAFCKIFGKAGYHWALGLLMLVPIANLVMPLYLAFGQWPVLQKAPASGLSSQPTPINIPPGNS